MKRVWPRMLLALVIAYAALALYACTMADRMLFLPPAPSYPADADGLVHLETDAGEAIAALHIPAADGRPTLLYSHGNAEDLGHSMPFYRELREQGFGVLAYDYPGYGQSSGTPTEKSCQRAIAAAWKFLTGEEALAPSDIVLAGRSVGSGPAVWLDGRESPRALVLISPFTSAFAVRAPAHLLLPGDRFPNLRRIRESDTPLLVLHGEADHIIPPAHGRKLHDASAAERKRFTAIPDAGHNDLYARAGDEVIEAIRAFADG